MNDHTARFSMNIAHAWAKEAGLHAWTRTIEADRDSGISIVDTYEMNAKPGQLTQSFMTTCAVNTNKPGRIVFEEPTGRKVLLDYDAGQWNVSVKKIQFSQPEDKKFSLTWEGRDIRRVLLTNTALAQKGSSRYWISK